MKAAVLEEFGKPLVIKEVELPQLLDDEVTIEVKACGLCLTDIHIQEGRVPTVTLPLIPGHEFSGVVIAKGSKVGIEWKRNQLKV
jgi:propanol-preferring alcohol dehydrogenase